MKKFKLEYTTVDGKITYCVLKKFLFWYILQTKPTYIRASNSFFNQQSCSNDLNELIHFKQSVGFFNRNGRPNFYWLAKFRNELQEIQFDNFKELQSEYPELFL